ncbi:MAG: NTP transferase domain-containing protein [Bacilli bacterium]|nr:NTP transferase domain-containing protein [Bacilli bacterium]
MKKALVAMILVGGQGSRLKEITRDTAKPAVSFGAKYRLIDFTLSNIANSKIDVVGVVTQYEPYDLMSYIGAGASWDLDIVDGGISFLTPFSSQGGITWQKGTADAIKQYFRFVREFSADYVLILSGDQIYKMDYQKVFEHHLTHNAQLTICATRVPESEASRFGIIEVDDSDYLTSFEEKPEKPNANLASMGIYLFNTDVLERLLSDTETEVDFGNNIIPKAIKDKYCVSVYEFNDYWKDVGTIDSLYQAHMDMIDDPDFLTLNVSSNLPVYSKSLNLPPHLILANAKVTDSIIADGSIIDGEIRHSSIGYETIVESGAIVEDSVILPGVKISKGAKLRNVIVNRNTLIPEKYICLSEKVILIDRTNLDVKGENHG